MEMEPVQEQTQSWAAEHKLRIVTTIYAITVVFVLEIYATYQHVDGFGLTFAIAAISGLGGYSLREIVNLRKLG